MKPNVHRIIYEFRLAKVGIERKKDSKFVVMRVMHWVVFELAEAHHRGGKYLVSHAHAFYTILLLRVSSIDCIRR